ncbi:MAG: pilus assembly protein CpaE, partial [Caulobacteraceae bacterium]
MTAQGAEKPDPFDLDFDAETEFATPDGEGRPQGLADPFEGLGGSSAEDEDAAPHAAPNPIAEMLAVAEAALGEHTVPRIDIHVFWTRAETVALVEQARGDRRMERAKTTAYEGGLATAVGFYQNQPTPSLLIVESLDGAAQLLGQLATLAEVCDPGTKVVVLGAANDIGLYRELMRRGVSEYLVPPLGPLQLIA